MRNQVPNRQAICDVLIDCAVSDKNVVVLCSDSRGSASMKKFADMFPKQFVEVGIAEQNLVSIAAGLAKCGKKVFVASPACFLASRSYEQIKIDCAYSDSNVTLIGVSGGISYGALGASHHSLQDIAAISAIPNMRVYLPSDRYQSVALIKELIKDKKPAYIRIGRNSVEDIYSSGASCFALNRANVLAEGNDVLIVACGEMVKPALDACVILKEKGISASLIDMYCVKPLDTATLLDYAQKVKAVLTVEEHSCFGGLGASVAQIVSANCPRKVINMAMPDTNIVAGTSSQVFKFYGLDANGIAIKATELLESL